MSSRMLLAILGLSAKSVVEEEDTPRQLAADGAKAVVPAASVARVRAAEKSFMVAVISVSNSVPCDDGYSVLWSRFGLQKIAVVKDFIPIPTLTCGS